MRFKSCCRVHTLICGGPPLNLGVMCRPRRCGCVLVRIKTCHELVWRHISLPTHWRAVIFFLVFFCFFFYLEYLPVPLNFLVTVGGVTTAIAARRQEHDYEWLRFCHMRSLFPAYLIFAQTNEWSNDVYLWVWFITPITDTTTNWWKAWRCTPVPQIKAGSRVRQDILWIVLILEPIRYRCQKYSDA